MSDNSVMDSLNKDMIMEIAGHLDLKTCLMFLNITKRMRNLIKTKITIQYVKIDHSDNKCVYEEHVIINTESSVISIKTGNTVNHYVSQNKHTKLFFEYQKMRYYIGIAYPYSHIFITISDSSYNIISSIGTYIPEKTQTCV